MSIPADLSNIIVPYISLIILVGVGILLAWRGILNRERTNVLNEIIFSFLLPVFIFWNAANNSVTTILGEASWMVGLGLCSGLIGYGLATVLARFARWEWRQRSVLQVSGVSGNTGFLGIPVCTALYGSHGAILALLYDLGASVYMLTIGLSAYQNNVQRRASAQMRFGLLIKQLMNPIVVAFILGIGMSLVGWQFPSVLRVPLESLSNTTTPLIMVTLGGITYHSALRYNSEKHRGVILLSILKLFIMPGLTWIVVQLLPLSGMSRGVAVIEAAMPSAVAAVTFASRYYADENLAASATMVTTLLAIITIPIFITFIR